MKTRKGGVSMKKKAQGMKGMIIMLIMLALVLGYYAYLSNRSTKEKEEEVVISAVQEVLLRDMERNYPPTPKEVIKYYSELTQCFYNQELTEEDLKALGNRAKEMYDEDLAVNQPEESYFSNLQFDIDSFHERQLTIVSFSTSSSTDVEEFTQDGRKWARLYCIYNLRQGSEMLSTQEVFLLRKDEEGHWKIYGWDLANAVETESADGNE